MKTIPLTRGMSAKVSDCDYASVSCFKWYALTSNTGPTYAARKCRGEVRLMHRDILGLVDRRIKTDHKNGDSLDNQRHNLRPATDQQNQRAFLSPRDNKSSRFRGVSWHKRKEKWASKIQVSGKQIHLGIFSDEEEAARAYDAAARTFFGEFASPNYKHEEK